MSRRIVLITVLLLAVASAAFATTVLKLDLPTLTEKSALIIKGTVTDVESRYESEGAKTISTFVTVKVEEVFKGAASDTVTIKVPGGTLDGQTMKVFGAPSFEKDERVFLLLEKAIKNENHYWVGGLFQGRYLIVQSQGVDYAVMDQGKGQKIFADCKQDIPSCLSGKGLAPMKLDELTGKVKALLKNPK